MTNKLTDEQKEEIQTALSKREKFHKDGLDEKWIRLLLSSEQAWKEKSDHMESLANEACKEANELRDQLNQAIEVLKLFADRTNWREDVHAGTVEWIGGGDPWNETYSLLSSLNKEET